MTPAGPTMRSILLAGLLGLLPSHAWAQSQTIIPIYTGQVTRETSEPFTTALANRVDSIVGVQVIVDPTDDRSPDGYLVDRISEDGGVYISRTSGNQGGVQINAPTAYWRHGSYVIDGYFIVKYGGMGQGIMGYQLKPVDEAAVLLSSSRRTVVAVDDIPLEPRAQTAD